MPHPSPHSSVRVRIDARRRHAELRLARPDTANLLDQDMISALTRAFRELAARDDLSAIVLAAEGDVFCSGIDLRWMQAGAHAPPAENLLAAATLAGLFKTIHDSPVPTIAKIQGDASSAGLGLVAACDIAIASAHAQFRTREVRVGILPALMSPYVVQAVGPRLAQYLFLTARPISAREALQAGLLHEVCRGDQLDAAVAHCVNDLVQGNPASLRATKALVQAVAHRAVTDPVVTQTTACIAEFRAHAHARIGIACAIDGVPPPWMESHESSR